MSRNASNFAPVLSLFVLIAIAHLPLGLPSVTSFVMPSIIIILIYIWSLEYHRPLPSWLIFSLGLIADVLSNGPIGYWPLYYLSAQALSFWFASNPFNSGLVSSWIGFLFTAIATTFIGWSVATLYFMRSADWQPMIIGILIGIVSYPAIFWLSGGVSEPTHASLRERL